MKQIKHKGSAHSSVKAFFSGYEPLGSSKPDKCKAESSVISNPISCRENPSNIFSSKLFND